MQWESTWLNWERNKPFWHPPEVKELVSKASTCCKEQIRSVCWEPWLSFFTVKCGCQFYTGLSWQIQSTLVCANCACSKGAKGHHHVPTPQDGHIYETKFVLEIKCGAWSRRRWPLRSGVFARCLSRLWFELGWLYIRGNHHYVWV